MIYSFFKLDANTDNNNFIKSYSLNTTANPLRPLTH